MSAENSRLTRAIQRIARGDPELRRAIGAKTPRGDQPGGQGVGESDAERDRVCCDGTVSGDANPGTSERETSGGGQDGLNPDDPADIGDAGPGELSGVVDCAAGEPVCFDGGDFIPPEGWGSPSDPPIDPGYEEGFFWYIQRMESFVWVTYYSCGIFYSESAAEAGIPGCVGGSINDATRRVVRCICEDLSGACSIFVGSYGTSACNPSPEDLVIETEWPSDSCVNLAIKGGRIVGSKYDPENDGSYSAPRDEIELCDPENGTSILLRPSADGGWKSIESLDGDIDPDTGYGYLYRPNGQRVRQISPSEFRDDRV